MNSKKISYETKLKAVGEALLGIEKQEIIAERHGLSSGYLSTLVNRARRAIVPHHMGHTEELDVENQEKEILNELSEMKKKIDHLELKITKK